LYSYNKRKEYIRYNILRKVPKAVENNRVIACYISGGGRGGEKKESNFKRILNIYYRVLCLIRVIIRIISPKKKLLKLLA